MSNCPENPYETMLSHYTVFTIHVLSVVIVCHCRATACSSASIADDADN